MAKTALLTGVGRSASIATGIARRLAAEGWNLALAHWPAYDDRMPWGPQPDDTPALTRELAATGVRVSTHIADLADPAAPPDLVRAAQQHHGPLHALILCHCESVDSTLRDTTPESFDRHFAVNARASLQLIQTFAGQVPATGGSVLALTSDALHGNAPMAPARPHSTASSSPPLASSAPSASAPTCSTPAPSTTAGWTRPPAPPAWPSSPQAASAPQPT